MPVLRLQYALTSQCLLWSRAALQKATLVGQQSDQGQTQQRHQDGEHGYKGVVVPNTRAGAVRLRCRRCGRRGGFRCGRSGCRCGGSGGGSGGDVGEGVGGGGGIGFRSAIHTPDLEVESAAVF